MAEKVHPVASLSKQGLLLNGFSLKGSTCILKLENLCFLMCLVLLFSFHFLNPYFGCSSKVSGNECITDFERPAGTKAKHLWVEYGAATLIT